MRGMIHSGHFGRVLSVACVALLCLHGCGSEGGSPVSPPPTGGNPPPKPAPPPPPATGALLPEHLLLAGARAGDVLHGAMACTDTSVIEKNNAGKLIFRNRPDGIGQDAGLNIALPQPDEYELEINGFHGTLFSKATRSDAGPLFDMFVNHYPERFEIPWRAGEVDLKHSTFGLYAVDGAVCFFAGGPFYQIGGPAYSGVYEGFADGLAFVSGDVYRLYGSFAQISAPDSLLISTIQLYGFKYVDGIFEESQRVFIGSLEASKTDGSASMSGPFGSYSGQLFVGPVGQADGAAGTFAIESGNGDTIFGVVALDQR